MKFRKIDDGTVRCIISKEDMQEYGIVLEDFFKNKSKVHEFLHEIVERAEKEVGYEPKEGLLSMQIMPISPNTISITFSEHNPEEYENMMNNLKDSMGEFLGEDPMILGDSAEEDEEFLVEEEKSYSGSEAVDTDRFVRNTLEGMEKSDTIMISMHSIEKIAKFCRVLNIDKPVKSELYYLGNKDIYCLIIEKNRLSAAIMRHILILAVEYTSYITDEMKLISHVREYGECIIEKSASRILKTYM